MARSVIFVNNSASDWDLPGLGGRVVPASGTLDVTDEISDDGLMAAIQNPLAGIVFTADRFLRINGVDKSAAESENYGNMAEGPDPAPHALGGSDHTIDTLANLNSKISDADLDDSGDQRPPRTHDLSHQQGGPDEINVTGLSGELADPQPPKQHDLAGTEHNADTLAALNSKISDAALDDAGDPRTPTAHAPTHEGGSDPISPAGIGAEPTISPKNTAFNKDFGSGAGDVCEGDDARLSDARTPLAHDLAGAEHNADTLADLNSKISDATLDDSGDPRDPNAHSGSHENGGADEISVAGLSGVLADAQTPAAHKDSHKLGGGDAFLSTDLLDAVVRRLRETGGPTDLLLGAVADGQNLRRSGTSIVGASPPSGQQATATSTTSTTSSSLTPISGMSITPGAGTYLAWFSSSFYNSGASNAGQIAIFVGGSEQVHSRRWYSVPAANVYLVMSTLVYVTVGAGQAIDVRWRTAGGTFYCEERALMLLKIA